MEDKSFEVKVHPNDLLKRERDLRGWSFKDVADRIACPDVRLVRRWERGDVFPSSEYRQKLCQLFEKNTEDLGLLKELYKKMPTKQQKKIPVPFQPCQQSPLFLTRFQCRLTTRFQILLCNILQSN